MDSNRARAMGDARLRTNFQQIEEKSLYIEQQRQYSNNPRPQTAPSPTRPPRKPATTSPPVKKGYDRGKDWPRSGEYIRGMDTESDEETAPHDIPASLREQSKTALTDLDRAKTSKTRQESLAEKKERGTESINNDTDAEEDKDKDKDNANNGSQTPTDAQTSTTKEVNYRYGSAAARKAKRQADIKREIKDRAEKAVRDREIEQQEAELQQEKQAAAPRDFSGVPLEQSDSDDATDEAEENIDEEEAEENVDEEIDFSSADDNPDGEPQTAREEETEDHFVARKGFESRRGGRTRRGSETASFSHLSQLGAVSPERSKVLEEFEDLDWARGNHRAATPRDGASRSIDSETNTGEHFGQSPKGPLSESIWSGRRSTESAGKKAGTSIKQRSASPGGGRKSRSRSRSRGRESSEGWGSGTAEEMVAHIVEHDHEWDASSKLSIDAIPTHTGGKLRQLKHGQKIQTTASPLLKSPLFSNTPLLSATEAETVPKGPYIDPYRVKQSNNHERFRQATSSAGGIHRPDTNFEEEEKKRLQQRHGPRPTEFFKSHAALQKENSNPIQTLPYDEREWDTSTNPYNSPKGTGGRKPFSTANDSAQKRQGGGINAESPSPPPYRGHDEYGNLALKPIPNLNTPNLRTPNLKAVPFLYRRLQRNGQGRSLLHARRGARREDGDISKHPPRRSCRRETA